MGCAGIGRTPSADPISHARWRGLAVRQPSGALLSLSDGCRTWNCFDIPIDIRGNVSGHRLLEGIDGGVGGQGSGVCSGDGDIGQVVHRGLGCGGVG